MNSPSNQTGQTLGSDAIGKVFASLRDVEAPAGMEDRILRTLEARKHSRGRVSPSSLPKIRSPRVSILRLGFTASLALAASLIAISFLHSTRHTGTARQLPSVPIASTPPHSSVPHPPVPDRQSPGRIPVQAIRAAGPASPAQSQPLSDEEALALSEMLAPSKPAPPLPLTPQEKMLAEVVHRGEPEELASLSPDVRARQMELSQAEFHDFFEPPPSKASE